MNNKLLIRSSAMISVILLMAIVGTWLLQSSHAATPAVAVEAESGILSGNITVGNTLGASGNGYVTFGSIATPNKMIVYGDSIAAEGSRSSWLQLSQDLGLTADYLSVAQSNTTTSEIAVRMGALNVIVNSTAGNITSSPITVTPVTKGAWRDNTVTWKGVLTNGSGQKIAGTLSHDAGGGSEAAGYRAIRA